MVCLLGEGIFSAVLKANMDIQVGREGTEGGENKSEGAQALYFYVIVYMDGVEPLPQTLVKCKITVFCYLKTSAIESEIHGVIFIFSFIYLYIA